MKMAPVAAAVPVLLLLLTWISFRAIDTDAERYDRALEALDRFAAVETALHRDVLSARAGMLRSYDPLVWEVNALREALDRLRNNASDDAEDAAAIARFAEAAARQEELTEQFKSDNALLQNSLAHFRLFSARLSQADAGDALARAVSVLSAAMLQLTLDTSPAAAREVIEQLNGLAAQQFPSRAGTFVDALLAHGRLLHDLLPKIDGVLRALLAAPSKQELKALRAMVLSHQAASRATAREFRLLLYMTSLLLLGLLVHLGMQLRARALMLRRRAACEHMIASMSTRLIDAQPHEVDAHIDRALAELGEHVGADRAYVVITGGPVRKHGWCRDGVSFPANWPDQVPALVARFQATTDGVIQIRSMDQLPGCTDKDVLAAASLGSWMCVSKSSKSGQTIISALTLCVPAPLPNAPRPDCCAWRSTRSPMF